VVGLCQHDNEPSGSIKGWVFFDWLSVLDSQEGLCTTGWVGGWVGWLVGTFHFIRACNMIQPPQFNHPNNIW
jgi:hypothetical protein